MGTAKAGQFHQLIDAKLVLIEQFLIDTDRFLLVKIFHRAVVCPSSGQNMLIAMSDCLLKYNKNDKMYFCNRNTTKITHNPREERKISLYHSQQHTGALFTYLTVCVPTAACQKRPAQQSPFLNRRKMDGYSKFSFPVLNQFTTNIDMF